MTVGFGGGERRTHRATAVGDVSTVLITAHASVATMTSTTDFDFDPTLFAPPLLITAFTAEPGGEGVAPFLPEC